MLKDFLKDDLPEGSYDLVVIGAGAAGLTIASELAGRRLRVALVESGGFEFEPETQALYEGENLGRAYDTLDSCRFRYFGGTTNQWGGWCKPLDKVHFIDRPWLSATGWPFGEAELAPYMEKTAEIVDTASPNYDLDFWKKTLGLPEGAVWDLSNLGFRTRVYQFSEPTRFGEKYKKTIVSAQNIDLLVHANAVHIELADDARSVSSIRLKSLSGKTAEVRGKNFVLAMGAIENPRLLLASNNIAVAGVGNEHDLVGRYFMEHPHLAVGRFQPAWGAPLDFYEGRTNYHGRPASACVVLSQATQQEEELLQCRFEISPVYHGEDNPGTIALKTIVRSLKAGEWPEDFVGLAGDVLDNLEPVAKAVAGYLSSDGAKVDHYLLTCSSEQEPQPDSRVLLTGDRDALGLQRVALDWRLSDLDFRSVSVATDRISRALGAAGLGRVRKDLGDTWPESLRWGWHHMGTTRMSRHPSTGVVDANCRVHGLENLYIAGSSVFPFSGSGVPTFTIVALALRLVEHLQAQRDS